MRGSRAVLVILLLVMLSASAGASEMLYQLGSTLAGFPVTMADNIFPKSGGEQLGALSIPPGMAPLFSSGSASGSHLNINNPASGISSLYPTFSGLSLLNNYQTAPLATAVRSPFARIDKGGWEGTPMTPDEKLLLNLQNAAYDHALPPTWDQKEKAMDIVSKTDMYKKYMQYPNKGWNYQWSYPYDGHTLMMTSDINPNPDTWSMPHSMDQLHNPDADVSGQLTFVVDLNSGTIIRQDFGDYRNML